MLVRRGFRPSATSADLPFAPEDTEVLDPLSEKLGHYAFRLFLRGAIQKAGGFAPAKTTRYLKPEQASRFAEDLVTLGLARRLPRGRYALRRAARSFGGTLEWYVARELRRRHGMDTLCGVKCGARGVGGDLDVVAAAEGKLVYLELKSSPPRHLSGEEVGAFLERVRALRPHVSLFVMDTALRLADKVLPMLVAAMRRRGRTPSAPRRIVRDVWALTPHVYAVSAKGDLVSNIGCALAEGLRALAPEAP
jgi:hypothetical protein